MTDTGPLPEIAVSTTSSQASSSKSAQAPAADQDRPSIARIDTNEARKLRWKSRKAHSESWHRRYDPGPDWHIKWTKDCFQNGRVLIIDYLANDKNVAQGEKRHVAVAAQELQTVTELEKFYENPKRVHGAALRVIHVQNAPWATIFLLRKFNINHENELIGMPGFSKWAKYEKPRQKNGKPFPNGRSWRGQTDPWRNVSRTAFGMDYLKAFPTAAPQKRRRQTVFGTKPVDAQVMHLNAYEDSHSPHGYDVSVQRMSVYVQRNLGSAPRISPDVDVQNLKNPYAKHLPNGVAGAKQDEGKICLEDLDNSNTVIVFETSSTLSLHDCLVQPRNDFEKRWRRLSFYLRREDVLNDSRLAAQCTNFILTDIFHGLRVIWDVLLNVAADHVAILEDKIYENPADESRAPELWTNQAAWLKVDKIVWIHSDMVREVQAHMRELADADDEDQGVEVDWLANTPEAFQRLEHIVAEDLCTATNNLSDLMYKSVGIRDSRQSLQLGLSMWRLSWITFIFLPLTFAVGFFGMNVDTFGDDPSIGWYFVAAVILMLFVLILWYGVKHSLQRGRQTPYQRGLYESLFNNLEEEYPSLWTTNGAVQDFEPTSSLGRFKWKLLKRWFSPEKTIDKQTYSSLLPEEQTSELGAWATLKRYLLLRWLRDLKQSQQSTADSLEAGDNARPDSPFDPETINELAKFSTPIMVADAEPTAVVPLSTFGLTPLHASERRSSVTRVSEDRPSSRGSSGIMFEERNLSDSESDAAEGAGAGAPDYRRGSTNVGESRRVD